MKAQSTSTAVLVRRAKRGDGRAWDRLIDRYYDVWLSRYHGKLGRVIRRLYDTEALVQSAVGDAVRDLDDLKNDAVFASWVSAIIRHKLAKNRLRLEREEELRHRVALRDATLGGADGKSVEEQTSSFETYVRVLDAMIELFDDHPEEMAALYLRFLEGCSPAEVIARLDRPKTTVYRWLRNGTARLRERLGR